MNPIRKRLLFSWLLIAAWIVLLMLHHPFLAWCILLLVFPLVRQGLPRPSLSPGLRIVLLCGLIGFLAAEIIDQYDALPAALLAAGQVVEALVCIPLVLWLGFFDYKTFRTALTGHV